MTRSDDTPIMIEAPRDAAPAFAWDDWYASVGGRTVGYADRDEWLRKIYEEQYPRFEGPVAAEQHGFASREEATETIKATARACGADIVGICEIEPSDLYRGRSIDARYAVAVGQRMRWRAFQTVPSEEAALECLRIYYTLGETVIALAEAIRRLGYACRIEHPLGDSDLLHIPIGLKAGFGELGRHGSIIHPELGPLFRMGSVATSIPMVVDHPVDAGIAAFCDDCRACRKYCPADAIPDERDPAAGKDHLGNDRYVVDTGRCFPYFARHHYCSICLPVCVYNHKAWARDFEGFKTKLFPEVVMEAPPSPVDPVSETGRHAYPRLKR